MGKRRLADVGDEDEVKAPETGSEDEQPVEVKPLGEVIKRSNKGKTERRHYAAVELDGVRYDLEDAVLVAPEQRGEKPYVAIMKEIKQAKDGSVAVTGQWFYRPEEAEKKGGGSWTSFDSRELFYSFHRDEVPAESVMHKCVVHFIPPQKEPPLRTKHPGFIIRQVYDTVEKKLWKLTDKDYEDSKPKEIDLLVQKTREALGELPDIEVVEAANSNDGEEADKNRRQVRRRAVPLINVTRDDSSDIVAKGDPPLSTKVDTPSTPGSGFPSDVMDLLRTHNALTGQTARDRWLEKIVRTLKSVLDTEDQKPMEAGEADGNLQQDPKSTVPSTESEAVAVNDRDGMRKGNENMWPASAICAGSALEKVAHEFNGSDVHKYNLKMRQLEFNLKKSPVLARRLLSKDLEPATVFHMTPVELKDGFTAAEKRAREPPEIETLQMTDARCKICGERAVGVKDIIHVGYGDRYQLECLKCGTSWYASRDQVSAVTTEDQVNASPAVGLAPWATSKFEEVEKELQSPRESERAPGVHESVSSVQAVVPEGVVETHAPESHYAEVERMLTEPINLSGPGLSVQDQSKVDVETTGADEKQKMDGETTGADEKQTMDGETTGADEKQTFNLCKMKTVLENCILSFGHETQSET